MADNPTNYEMPIEDRQYGRVGASLPDYIHNDTIVDKHHLDRQVFWSLNRQYYRALEGQARLCDIRRYTDFMEKFTINRSLNDKYGFVDGGYNGERSQFKTYSTRIKMSLITRDKIKDLKNINYNLPRTVRDLLNQLQGKTNIEDFNSFKGSIISELRDMYASETIINEISSVTEPTELRRKLWKIMQLTWRCVSPIDGSPIDDDGYGYQNYYSESQDYYAENQFRRKNQFRTYAMHTPDYFVDSLGMIYRRDCKQRGTDNYYFTGKRRYPKAFTAHEIYTLTDLFERHPILYINGTMINNAYYAMDDKYMYIFITTDDRDDPDLDLMPENDMKNSILRRNLFTLVSMPTGYVMTYDGISNNINFYDVYGFNTSAFSSLTPEIAIKKNWWMVNVSSVGNHYCYSDTLFTSLNKTRDGLYVNTSGYIDLMNSYNSVSAPVHVEAFNLQNACSYSHLGNSRLFQIPFKEENGEYNHRNPIPPDNIMLYSVKNGTLSYIHNANIILMYPNVYYIYGIERDIDVFAIWFYHDEYLKGMSHTERHDDSNQAFSNIVEDYMEYSTTFAGDSLTRSLPEYIANRLPNPIVNTDASSYDKHDTYRKTDYNVLNVLNTPLYDVNDFIRYNLSTMTDSTTYDIDTITKALNYDPSKYEYIYKQLMQFTANRLHANPKMTLDLSELSLSHAETEVISEGHINPDTGETEIETVTVEHEIIGEYDSSFTDINYSNPLRVSMDENGKVNIEYNKFDKKYFLLLIDHVEYTRYHYSVWVDGKYVNSAKIFTKACTTYIYIDPDIITKTSKINVEMMRTSERGRVVEEIEFGDLDTSIPLPKSFEDVSPQNMMVSIKKDTSTWISDTEFQHDYADKLNNPNITRAAEDFGVEYYYQVASDYEMMWLLFGYNRYKDGKRQYLDEDGNVIGHKNLHSDWFVHPAFSESPYPLVKKTSHYHNSADETFINAPRVTGKFRYTASGDPIFTTNDGHTLGITKLYEDALYIDQDNPLNYYRFDRETKKFYELEPGLNPFKKYGELDSQKISKLFTFVADWSFFDRSFSSCYQDEMEGRVPEGVASGGDDRISLEYVNELSTLLYEKYCKYTDVSKYIQNWEYPRAWVHPYVGDTVTRYPDFYIHFYRLANVMEGMFYLMDKAHEESTTIVGANPDIGFVSDGVRETLGHSMEMLEVVFAITPDQIDEFTDVFPEYSRSGSGLGDKLVNWALSALNRDIKFFDRISSYYEITHSNPSITQCYIIPPHIAVNSGCVADSSKLSIDCTNLVINETVEKYLAAVLVYYYLYTSDRIFNFDEMILEYNPNDYENLSGLAFCRYNDAGIINLDYFKSVHVINDEEVDVPRMYAATLALVHGINESCKKTLNPGIDMTIKNKLLVLYESLKSENENLTIDEFCAEVGNVDNEKSLVNIGVDEIYKEDASQLNEMTTTLLASQANKKWMFLYTAFDDETYKKSVEEASENGKVFSPFIDNPIDVHGGINAVKSHDSVDYVFTVISYNPSENDKIDDDDGKVNFSIVDVIQSNIADEHPEIIDMITADTVIQEIDLTDNSTPMVPGEDYTMHFEFVTDYVTVYITIIDQDGHELEIVRSTDEDTHTGKTRVIDLHVQPDLPYKDIHISCVNDPPGDYVFTLENVTVTRNTFTYIDDDSDHIVKFDIDSVPDEIFSPMIGAMYTMAAQPDYHDENLTPEQATAVTVVTYCDSRPGWSSFKANQKYILRLTHVFTNFTKLHCWVAEEHLSTNPDDPDMDNVYVGLAGTIDLNHVVDNEVLDFEFTATDKTRYVSISGEITDKKSYYFNATTIATITTDIGTETVDFIGTELNTIADFPQDILAEYIPLADSGLKTSSGIVFRELDIPEDKQPYLVDYPYFNGSKTNFDVFRYYLFEQSSALRTMPVLKIQFIQAKPDDPLTESIAFAIDGTIGPTRATSDGSRYYGYAYELDTDYKKALYDKGGIYEGYKLTKIRIVGGYGQDTNEFTNIFSDLCGLKISYNFHTKESHSYCIATWPYEYLIDQTQNGYFKRYDEQVTTLPDGTPRYTTFTYWDNYEFHCIAQGRRLVLGTNIVINSYARQIYYNYLVPRSGITESISSYAYIQEPNMYDWRLRMITPKYVRNDIPVYRKNWTNFSTASLGQLTELTTGDRVVFHLTCDINISPHSYDAVAIHVMYGSKDSDTINYSEPDEADGWTGDWLIGDMTGIIANKGRDGSDHHRYSEMVELTGSAVPFYDACASDNGGLLGNGLCLLAGGDDPSNITYWGSADILTNGQTVLSKEFASGTHAIVRWTSGDQEYVIKENFHSIQVYLLSVQPDSYYKTATDNDDDSPSDPTYGRIYRVSAFNIEKVNYPKTTETFSLDFEHPGVDLFSLTMDAGRYATIPMDLNPWKRELKDKIAAIAHQTMLFDNKYRLRSKLEWPIVYETTSVSTTDPAWRGWLGIDSTKRIFLPTYTMSITYQSSVPLSVTLLNEDELDFISLNFFDENGTELGPSLPRTKSADAYTMYGFPGSGENSHTQDAGVRTANFKTVHATFNLPPKYRADARYSSHYHLEETVQYGSDYYFHNLGSDYTKIRISALYSDLDTVDVLMDDMYVITEFKIECADGTFALGSLRWVYDNTFEFGLKELTALANSPYVEEISFDTIDTNLVLGEYNLLTTNKGKAHSPMDPDGVYDYKLGDVYGNIANIKTQFITTNSDGSETVNYELITDKGIGNALAYVIGNDEDKSFGNSDKVKISAILDFSTPASSYWSEYRKASLEMRPDNKNITEEVPVGEPIPHTISDIPDEAKELIIDSDYELKDFDPAEKIVIGTEYTFTATFETTFTIVKLVGVDIDGNEYEIATISPGDTITFVADHEFTHFKLYSVIDEVTNEEIDIQDIEMSRTMESIDDDTEVVVSSGVSRVPSDETHYEVTAIDYPWCDGFYALERRRFYQYLPYGENANRTIYITPIGCPSAQGAADLVRQYLHESGGTTYLKEPYIHNGQTKYRNILEYDPITGWEVDRVNYYESTEYPESFFSHKKAIIQNTDIYNKFEFTMDVSKDPTVTIPYFIDDPNFQRFRVMVNGYRMDHGTDYSTDINSIKRFFRGDSIKFRFDTKSKAFIKAIQGEYASYETVEGHMLEAGVISDDGSIETKYVFSSDGTLDGFISPASNIIYMDTVSGTNYIYIADIDDYRVYDPNAIVDDGKTDAEVIIEYLPYKERIVYKSYYLNNNHVDVEAYNGGFTRPLSFAYYDFYLNGKRLNEDEINILTPYRLDISLETFVRKSRLTIYERCHDPDLYGNEIELPKSLNDEICAHDENFRTFLANKNT